LIQNPGFESGNQNQSPTNWTVVGTPETPNEPNPPKLPAYVFYKEADAHSGYGYLDIWALPAYTVTVTQLVPSMPNGTYSLSVWYIGGTGAAYTSQYVFVRGYDSGNASAELRVNTAPSNAYSELNIPSIPVTSGKLEIGFYSNSPGNSWSHFDDLTLIRLP
jgi:hypothetical protein